MRKTRQHNSTRYSLSENTSTAGSLFFPAIPPYRSFAFAMTYHSCKPLEKTPAASRLENTCRHSTVFNIPRPEQLYQTRTQQGQERLSHFQNCTLYSPVKIKRICHQRSRSYLHLTDIALHPKQNNEDG